jgi:hypothetical protein
MASQFNYREAFGQQPEKIYDNLSRPVGLNKQSTSDDIIKYQREFNIYAGNKGFNPFYGVTDAYLNSIKAYSQIDDNFGFDGRYFHIGNNPQPIDKIQTSIINTRMKTDMAAATNPNIFYKYKYHIIATKFLHSLNRANRYLKSIMDLERKANKSYRLNDPNDPSMKKFMKEKANVIAWFSQPAVELKPETIDSINNGLQEAINTRSSLIPQDLANEFRAIGNEIRSQKSVSDLTKAKRYGFRDIDSRKKALKDYSKQIKRSKINWAWNMPLAGFEQITHTGNLISIDKANRGILNTGVRPQVRWGTEQPIGFVAPIDGQGVQKKLKKEKPIILGGLQETEINDLLNAYAQSTGSTKEEIIKRMKAVKQAQVEIE